MSKSLVVCCDGTWDEPAEQHAGRPTCTNVYKLWRALADTDRPGAPQRSFYHEGVGTGGRLDRVFGGAFGAGLAHAVCDCYRFLVLNHEPGDRIYLFGFSRGAYTARSLAGMVRNCGILMPQNFGRLGDAFRLYRDRGRHTTPASDRAAAFRRAYAQEVQIHFIGVWDTVGAMGVPVPIPFWRPWWAFHDRELSSHVSNAFHALAIDEERGPFKPTLWTRDHEPHGQILEQVWFAGCHRDVGGGEPDPDLADITLMWMMQRAEACGLAFQAGKFVYAQHSDDLGRYEGLEVHPDPLGRIHQSRRGIWKTVWRHRRVLPYGGAAASYRLSKQAVSTSAVVRAEQRLDGYPPAQLAEYLSTNPPIADVAAGEQVGTVAPGPSGSDTAFAQAPSVQSVARGPEEAYKT
jgi:hypothetical protein